MAIIFADVFPEITKVYDHMQEMGKTYLRFGQTTYSFSAVSPTKPILRLFASINTKNIPSQLMVEYHCICADFTETSQLSRHNRAIVRAVYKNVFRKFQTIIDTTHANTEQLTKIKSDLAKLETQTKMVQSLKNLEKTTPRYFKICGVIIPLVSAPQNMFSPLQNKISDLNDVIFRCEDKIKSAHNTRTSKKLDEQIKDCCILASKRISAIKAELESLTKQPALWMCTNEWSPANMGALYPIKQGAFAFEPDKILGTGNAIHSILTYDGKVQVSSDMHYWTKSILINDLNGVLLANGINTNKNAPMLSDAELAKVGKISQIFGTVKVIEQNLTSIRDFKNQYCNFCFVKVSPILDKLKEKLREIGIDPDVSVL